MKRSALTFEEFETCIDEALRDLPKRFREILLKNEIAVIPRLRAPKPLRDEYRGGVVYGVFIGVPMGRFTQFQTEPTRIELYKESFERSFDGPEEMRRQIRSTVVHEIAHYFGFSEKEIRRSGY